MADYPAMARAAAARKGLPEDRFSRQIGVESVGYAVNVIECRLDSPAGARGIAQLMPVHWSAVDPCNPDAALDYAAGLMRSHLDYWLGDGKDAETAYGLALASYNAGRQATIDGLAGRKAWWPFKETVEYLVRIMEISETQARAIMTGGKVPKVTYNASEPAHPQDKSYDCSQESLEWALWSLGRKPADGWLESTMIAEGVMSADAGLLDSSGAGLAAFIGRHYGEFGFYGNNERAVTFDGAAHEGDHQYPILVGGRRFGAAGHWVGVRGYSASRDVLLLANPSDGYDGIRQEMTRAEWEARGPWSMVRVLHPDLLESFTAAPPAPDPVPEPPSRKSVLISEIRARLEELERIA